MSGIAKASDKMKKKLSFGDYSLSPEVPPAPLIETVPQPIVAARKIYSLSKEDGEKLHAIFSRRLGANQSTSIATIMSEAINQLYQHEISAGTFQCS